MKPLRVVIYAPHFAEYSLRLAEGLTKKASVMLVCEKRNLQAETTPGLVAKLRKNVELVTFDGSAGILTGPFARRVRLPWLISRFQPDVAHVQEQADAPTAAMLDRLSHYVPVVLTVHDPRPHIGGDTAYAERGLIFRERLRAKATAYHVHGAFCDRELRVTRHVDRPLLSTAHGVLFVPKPDKLRPPEAKCLLFFGRMEAYKGLEPLLDATDILRSQGCAFRLIVAGHGPEIARLSSRLSKPDIELHDRFIPHEEAIDMLQRASFVVAPYVEATQSGIIASAFGNDRPVVVSSVGGLSDFLLPDFDSVCVPPNNPNALATALASLLLDSAKLQRLAAGATQKKQGVFDWEMIAERLEPLYREIIETRRKHDC